MDPLAIVSYEGHTNADTLDYSGPVAMLTLLIPISRIPDLSRNDTLRKELADLIKNAIPQENP